MWVQFSIWISPPTDITPDLDVDPDVALAPSSVLNWIGLTKVPFLIWLVSFLPLFGLSGLVLQRLLQNFLGATAPAAFASLIAAAPALASARWISNIVASIMPKTALNLSKKCKMPSPKTC